MQIERILTPPLRTKLEKSAHKEAFTTEHAVVDPDARQDKDAQQQLPNKNQDEAAAEKSAEAVLQEVIEKALGARLDIVA